MGFVADAIGDVVGSVTGSKDAAKAGVQAAGIQADATMAGVDEQRRQFDSLVQLMSPYVSAGTSAIGGQQALLGLSGAEAQRQAIAGLESSPQFKALIQQGENALLQNASATGGLRGGNLQAALAQFRPQMLSQLIDQQYGRLGGLAGLGQASAAMQAAAGQESSAGIAELLQQAGAARAGGTLAAGSQQRQTFGDLLGIGTMIAGF